MANKIPRVHEILSDRIKTYIESIKEVFAPHIGEANLKRLNEISDYRAHIIIGENGAINAHASNAGVFLPIEAYSVLEELKKFKGYGTDKSHKLYDSNTIINNDNTFYDYINHVIVTGSTPLDYYEDLLLHETMHFCGSGGAGALKEGINEYLTRKLALKKGFRTSACGYPKEVKVVAKLAEVLGEDIIYSIAFINDDDEIFDFIENKLGMDARNLYVQVFVETENEFHYKYYDHMKSYKGIEGIKLKAMSYEKINYDNVYKIIENYKKRKALTLKN